MNIFQKIENGVYEIDMSSPIRPVRPELKANPTPDEVRAYARALGHFEEELAVWRKAHCERNSRINELNAQFREDLEQEFDMVDHPKADTLFEHIYNRAFHSLRAMAEQYKTLVNLVR